jgi:hypothetical protein
VTILGAFLRRRQQLERLLARTAAGARWLRLDERVEVCAPDPAELPRPGAEREVRQGLRAIRPPLHRALRNVRTRRGTPTYLPPTYLPLLRGGDPNIGLEGCDLIDIASPDVVGEIWGKNRGLDRSFGRPPGERNRVSRYDRRQLSPRRRTQEDP